MTDAVARKSKAWLWVLLSLIAVVGGIAGSFALYIERTAAQRWSEAMAAHAQLKAKVNSDQGLRTPIVGPVQPGNAWDCYSAGMKPIMSRGGITPQDPKIFEFLLKEAGPDLAKIREGARCERAKADGSHTTMAQPALDLLLHKAKACLREDRKDAALDELAVALQVAVDAYPFMRADITNPLGLMKDLISGSALPSDVADRISTMAAGLDQQLPLDSQLWERHVVTMGDNLRLQLEHPEVGFRMIHRKHGGWIHSERLCFVEALDLHRGLVESLQRGEKRPWLEAKALKDLAWRDFDSADHPFAMIHQDTFEALDWRIRDLHARLRLIHAAALLRLKAGPDDPRWPIDPFTLKPMALKVDGAKVRISCVWMDGIEGSSGSWDPKADDEDLVLEVPR